MAFLRLLTVLLHVASFSASADFYLEQKMRLNVSVDASKAQRKFRRLDREVQFAASLALNWTAKDVRRVQVSEIASRIDRPTRYTLNSIYMKASTKRMLVATIGVKTPKQSRAKHTPGQTIAHQFTGGRRTSKGIERLLQQLGHIKTGEQLTIGGKAPQDRYGNLKRSAVNQIAKQLKGGSGKTRSGRVFWSKGGYFPRGVWLMKKDGPIMLLAVDVPRDYKQRLSLERTARRIVKRVFARHFRTALARALRS